MYYKFLIVIIILFFISLMTNCSILNQVVYHPDVDQGNYLSFDNISKIHIGMKKQQIIYLLGTPMITNVFGPNTLFYLFRREHNYKKLLQKTLILTFNDEDVLIHINNRPILVK